MRVWQREECMRLGKMMSYEDDPRYGDPSTYYADFYDCAQCGGASGLFRHAHRAMEHPYRQDDKYPEVIEVGAGTGIHFGFVQHAFIRYALTDLREASLEKARASFAHDPRVTCSVADAQDLPYDDWSFDRLIATCLLIHLPEPEKALIEWRRVVRPNGAVTIYVPNEGAFLHLARRLTTARAANRLGYRGYQLMVAREHSNRSQALDLLIAHTFRKDHLIRRGWPLHSSPLAFTLFTVYQARILT
jgi:phosphatidylethanolamine/phosphatidyl-N-methylethanolamine N-methyltransferase